MLGGGNAGLHSGASFRLEQRAQREAAGSGVGGRADDAGASAATVYRDKDGRLIDMDEKVARDKALAAALVAAKVVEKHEWGRGTVQKRAAAEAAEEFASVAAAPLARRADDAALEALLKARARDGDPMAGLVQAQQQPGRSGDAAKAAAPGTRRRVYTGPPPPPNRYGIAPGYRWDGVDRSNGWEAKLIAYKASRVSRAESEYHGRIADM